MDGTVLVADDDRTIRTVLTQALTRAGCRVHATSSLTTLMRWVAEGRGDVIITDVVMPDGNGLEMLPKISEDRPGMPVIVVSAQNTIMTAIKATEAEAFDYLPKPFDLPDLMKRTARALELTQKRRSKIVAEPEIDRQDALPLIGRSPVMQSLYQLVARVMNADLPVLLIGESGTGKTLIGRMIHDFSDRRNLPFITATASDLVDLEGPARVLARAKGGTLMFDEIADIDPVIQARIVRMIDAPTDHVPRFMATSQIDLTGATDRGKIRQDLYFRLGGATLTVPTLRERVEDIALLITHFLDQATANNGYKRGIALDAEELMRAYSWPGNVRQLENVVRRLALSNRTDDISRAEVELLLGNQPDVAPILSGNDGDKLSTSLERHLRRYFDLHGQMLPAPGLHARILREVETPLIAIALEATAGNQAKCADLLGINRNTLRKKITQLEIKVSRRRKLL